MSKQNSKKKSEKKLAIKRETLRRLTRALDANELAMVNGGGPCGTNSLIPTNTN